MFWRDPKSRGMLLGVPFIQIVLFSHAATMDVKNVDVGIINQDSGRWSAELIQRVSSARFVGEVLHYENPEDFSIAVENGDILLGLQFPADFSRRVILGETADVQVVIDGRKANSGQVAFSYVSAIAGGLDMEIMSSNEHYVRPAQAEVRYWFNPNLEFRWFMVPTLIPIVSMMTALLMGALSIARERELGTFDQLLVSPSTPLEILVSKTLPALLGAGFVGCLCLPLTIFGFDLPVYGELWILVLALLPFIFSVVGVGLVISSLANTQQQAILGLFFMMMPIMLTSGFSTPVENMPEFLQFMAGANPLKYMLVVVHGTFLKSMSAVEVWDNVWPLLVIGGVTFTTAVVFVQRRLQ